MEEFEGYVDRITFRNEENGYTVLYLVKPQKEGGSRRGMLCRLFFFVAEGEYLLVRGNRVVHKNYIHSSR